MITEIKDIVMRDGKKLKAEVAESGSSIWLVVTHGLAEHKGRHHYQFDVFAQYFNILTYDLRGHGNSEGQKGNIESFGQYVEDLEDIISYLTKSFSMKRLILFGHSMGGLVTASYMQKRSQFNLYPEKVFFSAPAVAAPGILGNLFQLSPLGITPFMANLPVSVPLGGMLDLTKLSHNNAIYLNYINDPLNFLKVHTHLFFQLMNEAREVFSKPLRIECDLYVAIGTKDELVNAKEVIRYFSEVEKNAKLLKIEDVYHEMHNEIER